MENIDTISLLALVLLHLNLLVYVNKQNTFGIPVFHVRGTNGSGPDLLVINPAFKHHVYQEGPFNLNPAVPTCFAVEVKPGNHLRELHEGIDQIAKYSMRWASGQVAYETNEGRVHHISWFLLATRYSDGGFLYKREVETPPLAWDWLSDTWGQLEYPISKDILSALFSKRRDARESIIERSKATHRAITGFPEFGILKRGVSMDGTLLDGYYAYLSKWVVPLEQPRAHIEIQGAR